MSQAEEEETLTPEFLRWCQAQARLAAPVFSAQINLYQLQEGKDRIDLGTPGCDLKTPSESAGDIQIQFRLKASRGLLYCETDSDIEEQRQRDSQDTRVYALIAERTPKIMEIIKSVFQKKAITPINIQVSDDLGEDEKTGISTGKVLTYTIPRDNFKAAEYALARIEQSIDGLGKAISR